MRFFSYLSWPELIIPQKEEHTVHSVTHRNKVLLTAERRRASSIISGFDDFFLFCKNCAPWLFLLHKLLYTEGKGFNKAGC